MKLSRSNTAAALGTAVVTVAAYITRWDAPPEVVGSAILIVSTLLSLVVKDS